jgi:hypothetical protein
MNSTLLLYSLESCDFVKPVVTVPALWAAWIIQLKVRGAYDADGCSDMVGFQQARCRLSWGVGFGDGAAVVDLVAQVLVVVAATAGDDDGAGTSILLAVYTFESLVRFDD